MCMELTFFSNHDICRFSNKTKLFIVRMCFYRRYVNIAGEEKWPLIKLIIIITIEGNKIITEKEVQRLPQRDSAGPIIWLAKLFLL